MATAYVKNSAIIFYQEPDEKTIVSQIDRNWSVQPHRLEDFAEGAKLGVLTGKTQGEFVQIDYEFDIRVQNRTGFAQFTWARFASVWQHHDELLWVKEADITTESPTAAAAKAAEKKAAEKKALVDKLVNDTTGNASLTGSGSTDQTGSGNGLLIGGIVAGVGLLIGVLIWAFRKNTTAPKAVAPPTIIQLSKPKKP